ncbi:MAG: hypothetical protein O7D29_06825, partial [Gemmatimonadetes bacterium]|nr:hypothetical protein [Gemmatimonadota bacterium]
MEIKISRIRRCVSRLGFVGNATRLLALAGLAACTGSQALNEGVYEVEASIGEMTLPANLELDRVGDNYRGRLTVMMGQPVHFALRSDGW